jgi:hypothetical protein
MAQPLKLCQTVRVMADRTLIILRYEGEVPAMASCAQCQRKFFTPPTFLRDRIEAERYLLNKFDQHECQEEPKRSSDKGNRPA